MSKNPYVTRCKDCNGVIGLDERWNRVNHCNLACKWLGTTVVFNLHGQEFTGHVEETYRAQLANGEHDILTVEFFDRGRQLKLQGHRQSFRRIND